MGIKLKAGKEYTPTAMKRYGVDLSGDAYYGKIDRIDYDKKSKTCGFVLEIFKSRLARDSEKLPIEQIPFTYTTDGFVENIGNCGLTITSAYEKALAILTDWESDL